MMFRAFLLLSLVTIPNFCFGGLYDGYEDVVQDPVFAPIMEYDKLSWSHMLPVVEEYMQKHNPEFAESVQDLPDDQKIVKYNNYLAEKVFNDYENLFLWNMQEKSKQTGREIKYKTFINEKTGAKELTRWLDRGKFDTDECKVTYHPKDYSKAELEKYKRDQREHRCLYPDGFEEFKMRVFHGIFSTLDVEMDDKQAGINYNYHISLRNNLYEDADIGQSVDLDAYTNEKDYLENHAWRNQIQQDLKDGYANPVLRCTGAKCKELEKLTQGETVSFWNRKVKSDDMVPKKTKIKGINISRSFANKQ